MKAIEGLRAAGATVVFDESILPDSFAEPWLACDQTLLYPRRNREVPRWVWSGAVSLGGRVSKGSWFTFAGHHYWRPRTRTPRRTASAAAGRIRKRPSREANVLGPRRKALELYNDTLDRLHLDGYVYPATQMPPPDETMPQDGRYQRGPPQRYGMGEYDRRSRGCGAGRILSQRSPFGLEISARPWRDGDLLGWAYAYESTTHHRKPPVLVEKGLLPIAR